MKQTNMKSSTTTMSISSMKEQKENEKALETAIQKV